MTRPLRSLSALALLALPLAAAGGDQPLHLSDTDTVVVYADEAWESDDRELIAMQGGVRIYAPQWAVLADRAELAGDLEDPDFVSVSGAPARLRVVVAERAGAIEGRSERIEFDRRADILRLDGAAALDDDGKMVDAGMIEYLLDRRLFRTGGEGRVRVKVTPK